MHVIKPAFSDEFFIQATNNFNYKNNFIHVQHMHYKCFSFILYNLALACNSILLVLCFSSCDGRPHPPRTLLASVYSAYASALYADWLPFSDVAKAGVSQSTAWSTASQQPVGLDNIVINI